MKPNPNTLNLLPTLQSDMFSPNVRVAVQAYIKQLQEVKTSKMAALHEAYEHEKWQEVCLESTALVALNQQLADLHSDLDLLNQLESTMDLQNPELLGDIDVVEVQPTASESIPIRKHGIYTHITEMMHNVLWVLLHASQPIRRKSMASQMEPFVQGHLTGDDLALDTEGIPRWHRKAADAAQELKVRGLVNLTGITWSLTAEGHQYIDEHGLKSPYPAADRAEAA